MVEYLGPYWRVVFSDYVSDAGGNRERLAFVYDQRALASSPRAAMPRIAPTWLRPAGVHLARRRECPTGPGHP